MRIVFSKCQFLYISSNQNERCETTEKILFVVLREPVANKIKYLSNESNDQSDQSKSK